MIGIIDYGVGNIESFRMAYKQLGIPSKRLRVAKEFDDVTHLILPGVGAFDMAMARFNDSGMVGALLDAISQNKPVLGVCVGMQMLAKDSEEGESLGLGIIDAHVRRFRPGVHRNRKLRCPHMGWNEVRNTQGSALMRGLDGRRFYFLHSYWFDAQDAQQELARTLYGTEFCSAASQGCVMGVQFHPEKSHSAGLALLKNFGEI